MKGLTYLTLQEHSFASQLVLGLPDWIMTKRSMSMQASMQKYFCQIGITLHITGLASLSVV